jgi:hypothetical protein
VEVRFKPVAGRERPGRRRDLALERRRQLLRRARESRSRKTSRSTYTQNGRRITIKYVDAPVSKNSWHTLRADFAGQRIRVALDGKTYIDLDDGHIGGAGRVGVWTKADSVTLFDDFTFQAEDRK